MKAPDSDPRRFTRNPHAADPAFRDRLRREFVSGELVSRGTVHRWRRGGALASVALAVAAALVVVFAIPRGGEEWALDPLAEGTSIEVDGRRVSGPRVLRAGQIVRVISGTADLSLRGTARFQAPAGAEFRLPSIPSSGLVRTGRAALSAGELRVVTESDFRGARLEIVMPEASAIVTGTAFAVIREPGRSCVCVLEGEVNMRDASGVVVPVATGTRRSVGPDGRDARTEPILAMERAKLEMLAERAAR